MNREELKKIKAFYYSYKFCRSIWSQVSSLSNEISGLKQLKNNLYANPKNTKIIVLFILQYIPSWEKGDYLFNYLRSQKDFDVFILCVPNDLQQPKCNEAYDFISPKGYQAINAFSGNSWFNIMDIEPDYIFTFRPYDCFMPSEYSAKNLCKIGKLCNIIYGPPMTTELQDVVYNKSFFDYVSFFFAENEESKKYFERNHSIGVKMGIQHAPFCGMPILEYIHKDGFSSEPSAWNTTRQIKILWTPRWNTDKKIGGSHFFDYCAAICGLVKKENCALIIRPHPLMFSNFEKTGEMTICEYEEFTTKCNNDNIIIDFSRTYLHTFSDTDILITDLSSIIQEFLILGKPIIYCPPSNYVHHTKTMKRIISACYIVNNSEELLIVVNKLINGEDELLSVRKDVVQELFGTTINNSCALICDVLRKDHKGK